MTTLSWKRLSCCCHCWREGLSKFSFLCKCLIAMLFLSYRKNEAGYCQVGDIGPILDMLAVVLESLPPTTLVARSSIYAVYRTARVISSIPSLSNDKKASIVIAICCFIVLMQMLSYANFACLTFQAFPDSLFHQLLVAMVHPDHQARIGAHSILSTVLMPSLVCPLSDQRNRAQTLKARKISFSDQDEGKDSVVPSTVSKEEVNQMLDGDDKQSPFSGTLCQSNSLKLALTDGKAVWNFHGFSFSLLAASANKYPR